MDHNRINEVASSSDLQKEIALIKELNPYYDFDVREMDGRKHRLQKVIIVNRGEIAKRFFFLLKEENIPSVAVVSDPDRGQSWYDYAREVIYIGDAKNYTNIKVILAALITVRANAVYPGYGFLSEDARFVEAIDELSRLWGQEIIFMGPRAKVMHKLGDKLKARELAQRSGVPLFEGTPKLKNYEQAHQAANQMGYPVLIKLSAGGGGKGMLAVYKDEELEVALESAQRIGKKNYNDDSAYLEKLIEKPVHIEVQIFNSTAVGLRKCAVQRRKQKVIEESGYEFLDDPTCLQLFAAAENMAKIANYGEKRQSGQSEPEVWGGGAGTVEFLFDAKNNSIGFLEVNTRLQVEYPVTDQSLQIDLAKWQVLYFDGRLEKIPLESMLEKRFRPQRHAIECRIYAEDVYNNYTPAPGSIQIMELPSFNGVRSDFGFRIGDRILADYDPMIGKLITRAGSRQEALVRMERSLSELYIGGIVTNIDQLLNIMRDPEFIAGSYTNLLLEKDIYKKSVVAFEDRAILCAFSALSYFMNCLQKNIERCFAHRNLSSLLLLKEDLRGLPYELELEINDINFHVQLVQLNTHVFSVFIDKKYFMTAEVHVRADSNLSYQIHVGNHSFPIRLDIRPDYLLLRIMDEQTKVKYYRVKISSQGIQGDDNRHILRCPFQSYFVRLFDDKSSDQPIRTGSKIVKGQPLMVIEAMKMETILRAPSGGVVDYIIDDGDLGKLVRGKTSDGLILGKTLNEGEPLMIISPEETEKKTIKKIQPKNKFRALHVRQAPELLPHVLTEELQESWEVIKQDPEYYFSKALDLLGACLKGLIFRDKDIAQINHFAKEVIQIWHLLSEEKKEAFAKEIHKHVEFVIFSRQLISPLLIAKSDYSFFEEFSDFILYLDLNNYTAAKDFSSILLFLMGEYGYSFDSTKIRNQDFKKAYYYVIRSLTDQKVEPLIPFIELLVDVPAIANKTAKLYRRLLGTEILLQKQILTEVLTKQLQKLPVVSTTDVIATGNMGLNREYLREFRDFILHPLAIFTSDAEKQQFVDQVKNARLLFSEKMDDHIDQVLANIPDWVASQIRKRLSILKSQYDLIILPTPFEKMIFFETRSKHENQIKKQFYCYIWLDEGCLTTSLQKNAAGQIISIAHLERSAIMIARIFRVYEVLFQESNFRGEIFANKVETPFHLHEDSIHHIHGDLLTPDQLRKVCQRVLRFFLHARAKFLMLNLLSQNKQQMISMYSRSSQVCFDLIPEDSPMHPLYITQSNPDKMQLRTQRLFEQFKWPISLWARETFDQAQYQEILIPGLDDVSPRKIGAVIYEGTLCGHPAIFYMKESRIQGGATGDLEGQKYAAAAYLAYVWDRPLYIFNDGAGANVKEGMIALNRAGLGFMINAMVAKRLSYFEFHSRLAQYPSKRIIELFQKIDHHFNISNKHKQSQGRPQHFFTVAVGIGSSTGLDVYGSSQANIQIMYDSKASYRVLTGSVVIASVTGESYTNYEIGGAQVMSENGTVDIIALDKITLIKQLREIHHLFFDHYLPQTSPPMQISQILTSNKQQTNLEKTSRVLLDEDIVADLVDQNSFIQFKKNFRHARGLFAGFARLNGNRFLILGTRTHHGCHTEQALIKATEVIHIAQKTETPIVLVTGRKWYAPLANESSSQALAALDLHQALHVNRQSMGNPIIQIICYERELQSSQIFGDIIITILPKTSKKVTNKSLLFRLSTFLASDLDQAFQICGVILNYFSHQRLQPLFKDEENEKMSYELPTQKINLPESPTKTFDMWKQVIEAIVDRDSFLSFHHPRFCLRDADLDDEWEPNLLTGLAQLQGQTVGIIADQCLHGRAPDALGTERFRIFVQFLDRYKIPLVMLSNAAGFLPGIKQEQLRIQQIGARSLDINILSKIPVASIVLLQNYGGRQIQAFSRTLRPGISGAAPATAKLAVMGASASFDLFYGREYQKLIAEKKTEQAETLRKKVIEEFDFKSRADQDAMQSGSLDFVFSSCDELRQKIIHALHEASRTLSIKKSYQKE